jgi:hypothetical protein
MCAARQVGEDGLGSAERFLRIDYPFRAPERGEEGCKRCRIRECRVRAEELEAPSLVSRDQHLQKLAPEQP